MTPLGETLKYEAVVTRIPARFRAHVQDRLTNGGLLAPGSFSAVVEAVRSLLPQSNSLLRRHQLNIPKAGLHAFRHGRVTVLRKNGTPGDLQKQWIGHSSLRTTDRYSHTDEELEYRRQAAGKVGVASLLDPVGPRFCTKMVHPEIARTGSD